MGFMLLESITKAVRKTEGPDDPIDHESALSGQLFVLMGLASRLLKMCVHQRQPRTAMMNA